MKSQTDILPSAIKAKVIIAMAAIGLTGVSGYFLHKWIRSIKASKEQQASFTLGSESTVAKQIKLAFENNGFWGTDVEMLRRIFIDIPTLDFFEGVKRSYSRLYNSILIRDLSDELQSSEYNEFLSIIASKSGSAFNPHKLWSSRLKSAFNKRYGWFSGTDEEAIIAVFIEIPTKLDYSKVEQVFFQTYGKTLEDSLEDELSFFDRKELKEILDSKP